MKDYEFTEGERSELSKLLCKMLKRNVDNDVIHEGLGCDILVEDTAERILEGYETIAWEDATGQFHGPMVLRHYGLVIGAPGDEDGFGWIARHGLKFMFAFAPLRSNKNDELLAAPLPVAICYEEGEVAWWTSNG